MFSRLFRKKPEVVERRKPALSGGRRITDTASVKAGAEALPRKATVVSLRAVPHAAGAESNSAGNGIRNRNIDSAAELPKYRNVLTVAGAKNELVESMRKHLVAISTSQTTAWIIAEKRFMESPQTKLHVSSLRERLKHNGFAVDRTAVATKELIAAVYYSASGLSDDGNADSVFEEEGKLFHEFIIYGVSVRASDVHFELRGQQACVRYRVDGRLEPMRNEQRGVYLHDQLHDAISFAYNKLVSKRTNSHAAFSSEVDQTCMIPYEVNGKHINLRWQSLKAHEGFDVILRFLHEEEVIKVERFQDLGYSDDQSAMLELGTRSARGLMLISGITGSGKTTTLKTSLEKIPERGQKKIITVEDPVEYTQQGLTQISIQRQVGDDKDTSFKAVQAKLMRSDPDTLMLGEIRDQQTGEAVQVFVETGHQVMATTHADSVFTVFSRLTSHAIGMSLHALTTPRFWSLIVYQALVPKLCEECRIPAEDVIPETLEVIRDGYEIDTSGMYCRNLDGCRKCNHRGTKGSTVVAEMMQPSRSMLKAIRQQDEYSAEVEWRSASDRKFDTPIMRGKTVFEHALYKAYQGVIDPRNVEQFDTFERFEKVLGP